jgi:diguanylate cyclase (GGDEF)-like protein
MPAASPALFDPRSIIAMASIMGLLMGGVMFFLRRIYPPNIGGLLQWAIAPFLCFVATTLYAARGLIPDLISSAGSNVILLGASVTFYFGSQRFHGVLPSYRFWLAVLGASAPVFVWFVVIDARFDVRVVLFTALMLWILAAHARLLLTVGYANAFTRPTGYLLILQGGFLLLRMMDALHTQGGNGLLDPSRMQITYLMTSTFTFLLLTVGLILMAAERMRTEFEHLATYDSLTGTLTRRAWLDSCGRELERCRRHRNQGHSMAIMMLDMDHFKGVNDTHGHQMGDRVLVDFAQRVRQQLRLPDRLGRFGGEEFVLMLPETSLEDAIKVAQRIRSSRRLAPELPMCTVSIGVAIYEVESDTLNSLLARADAALYRAKDLGRNRVETESAL